MWSSLQEGQAKAVSFGTHKSMRWKRYTSYSFSASDTICSLVVDEAPRAMLCQPIGFVSQQGLFTLVSVQGLGHSGNLLIDSSGAWRTAYVPAAYRAYPFFLSKTTDGALALCFDEGSGMLGCDEIDSERFFDPDGTISHALSQVVDFLKQLEIGRLKAAHACAVLSEFEMFELWPISLAMGADHVNIDGLYRINEKALLTLSGNALEKLRDAGALSLAYCQLLSMQHLPGLVNLLVGLGDNRIPNADIEFSFGSGNLDLSNI